MPTRPSAAFAGAVEHGTCRERPIRERSLPIRSRAVDAVTIVDRETRMSLLSALKESQWEGRSIGGERSGDYLKNRCGRPLTG
jgi:hypothetical protein